VALEPEAAACAEIDYLLTAAGGAVQRFQADRHPYCASRSDPRDRSRRSRSTATTVAVARAQDKIWPPTPEAASRRT